MDETNTTEASKTTEARLKAQRLAQETGEPYVTIELSENAEFESGEVLSLSVADKKLAELDAAHEGDGYDKVLLHIDYVKDGKPATYDGCRYDIGDEEQGLVDHISDYWQFYAENANWRKRLESEHSPDYVESSYEEYRRMAYDVAPYFKKHIELSAMSERAQAVTDFSAEDIAEVNAHVAKERAALNGVAVQEEEHEEKNDVIERVTPKATDADSAPKPEQSKEGSYRDKVNEVRDSMIQAILARIESDPLNWTAGWNKTNNIPVNGKTGTSYHGLNSVYLYLISEKHGYNDPRWVTFNQAKELGASIRKGEKSSPVLFYELYDKLTKKAYDPKTTQNMSEDERAEYEFDNVRRVLKFYRVFNAAQCENFPERGQEPTMTEEERENQNALIETIIANSAAPITYDGGDKAYYQTSTDSIHLPAIEKFHSMQDSYATALHEIAHSTGHASRLNRDLSGMFGTPEYATEELRAELACVFMQIEHGIAIEGKHIENHAAYVQSWLEAAKTDPTAFYRAVRDAGKIADYVDNNYLQAIENSAVEEITEEIRAEERANVNKLEANVKAWYTSAFPNDELGAEIKDDVTFADLNAAIENADNVYELLGVGDSIVRERTFGRLADLQDKSFSEIYDTWMGNAQGDELNQNIREWYLKTFPDDNNVQSIHLTATFKNLNEEVDNANAVSVYGILGADLKVRERVFKRLAELTNVSYSNIMAAYTGKIAAHKLSNARAQAQRLAQETGEPYVTIEWAEGSEQFPGLKKNEIMSLSEADKRLATLDAESYKEQGYYKTKLHIDFVLEGKLNTYESCRYNIGVEGGGLVHHIEEFLRYDTSLSEKERAEVDTVLKYFKRHIEISQIEDSSIDKDYFINFRQARQVVNEITPFDETKLSERLAELQSKYKQEEQGEHKEKEVNAASHYSMEFRLSYSYEMLLTNRLEKLGLKTDPKIHELNMQADSVAMENGQNVWVNSIRYIGQNGRELQGYYGRTFNGILLEATDITGFTTSEMSEQEVEAVAEIIRGFGSDVDVKALPGRNAPQVEEEHKEKMNESEDKKVDTPRNMPQQTQNTARETPRIWFDIDLPDGVVGERYGSNTMIKMPDGEYAHYALFVSSKLIRKEEGKAKLRVASDFTYRLNNDGRQVALNGIELRDSLAGMQIGKEYKRVGPSRRTLKNVENLRKNVPEEIKQMPYWACYRTRWDEQKGKKKKFIISPTDGSWASSKELDRWVTFEAALKYATENDFEGVSLLLDRTSGITCIDLDKCIIDAKTGAMKERAAKLTEMLKGTYMERSTSGNGIHIFVKDDILQNGTYRSTAETKVNDPRGDLEVFDDKRIISMTGDMISTH